MSKRLKIWLIVASCFIFVGAVLFVFAMAKNDWSFRKLGAKDFDTNTYEIEETFENISIKASTADIDFQYSNDGTCKVVCYENKKEKHETSVIDGSLNINRVNNREWYDYISLFSNTPKITVYLPSSSGISLNIEVSTGDVNITGGFVFECISISGTTSDITCSASSVKQTKISVSTGDINLENSSAENYDLSASTGDIYLNKVNCTEQIKIKVTTGDSYLKDVSCGGLASSGSTGDITLNNVIAVGNISISRSTGDIEFISCDAEDIVVETSTGDVEGTLQSNKVFIVRSDTGDINVPSTTTGGRCEITTDTGDINIQIVSV